MNDLLEKTLLLDFYGMLLTPKQKEMYEMKYNDDMSLSEIADEYGISRQGVSEAIKSADKTMKAYEDKLKLVSRFRSLNEIIDKLDKKISNKETINSKDITSIKKELENIRKKI